MKKYLLILGIGLLSTAAVTAAMLDTAETKVVKKEKKECSMKKKDCSIEKKKQCAKAKRSCFFS